MIQRLPSKLLTLVATAAAALTSTSCEMMNPQGLQTFLTELENQTAQIAAATATETTDGTTTDATATDTTATDAAATASYTPQPQLLLPFRYTFPLLLRSWFPRLMRGTPVRIPDSIRTLASTIRARTCTIRARICAIIVRTCTDRAIICATTARMHMVHARTVAVPRMDREQDRVRRTTAADDSVPLTQAAASPRKLLLFFF